jgi:hypothetical protein
MREDIFNDIIGFILISFVILLIYKIKNDFFIVCFIIYLGWIIINISKYFIKRENVQNKGVNSDESR